MNEVVQRIGELGLVPVIKIERAEDAVKLGRSLIEGDLPVAEVTFRTAAAEESIKRLSTELPDLLVGAGTVLSAEQAERAVNAGARFVVSPGFNPKVVDWCIDHGIPVTPGINSPTQLEMALERGLEVVKFFPAEASGGVAMLKAMAAPYSGVRFIPTGGVTEANLLSYLSFDRVLACGGSWMVKGDLISAGKFKEIADLVRRAVARVHGFELLRVGIAASSEEKAAESGQLLSWLFFWQVDESSRALTVGTGLELEPTAEAGGGSYLVVGVNNLDRAIAYLKRKGIEAVALESGAGAALNLDIHGHAVRLVRK